MKAIWSGDYECMINFFSGSFKNYKTKEVVFIPVHADLKNSHVELCEWCLDNLLVIATFNGLSYDYPLIHYGLGIYKRTTTKQWIDLMYSWSQNYFSNREDSKSFRIYKNNYFPVVDVMTISHFDNKSKSQSLKGLGCALGYHTIQEMPIKHSDFITVDQIPLMKEYNNFDTDITDLYLCEIIEKIKIRQLYQELYSVKGNGLLNLSDSSLGEQIILNEYCKETGLDKYYVKQLRTKRTQINIKECVFDYVTFKSKKFNEDLEPFINRIVYPDSFKITDDDKESYSLNSFNNGSPITYKLGNGGIHASLTGWFKSDKSYVIIDIDAEAYYPNIAVKNRFYPQHLGEVFLKVYEEKIVNESSRLKKLMNDESYSLEARKDFKSLRKGAKDGANAAYGKSNSEFSFLNDLMYTVKTVINGQLMLLMLIEEILLTNNEAIVLQANTDGFTVKIPRSFLDELKRICKEWENLTKQKLEFLNYEWMGLKNVSSYLAKDEKGDIKLKGEYEIEKERHKDGSYKIITKAVKEYFDQNIHPSVTINNCHNIYDFLGWKKFKSNQKASLKHYVLNNGKEYSLFGDEAVYTDVQKVFRFYVSTDGGRLTKHFQDSQKDALVEKDWLLTDANRITSDVIPDNLNKTFYIDGALKLINGIIDDRVSKKKKK